MSTPPFVIERAFVWGVAPVKPLEPMPEGKVRLRLRKDSFAIAFVRTDSGICKHAIQDNGATWSLGFLVAQKRRRP